MAAQPKQNPDDRPKAAARAGSLYGALAALLGGGQGAAKTVLDAAAQRGHDGGFGFFIEHVRDGAWNGGDELVRALAAAARAGNADFVKSALDRLTITANIVQLVYKAAIDADQSGIAILLLERFYAKERLVERLNEALATAVAASRWSVMEAAVKLGADPAAEENRLLRDALRRDDKTMVAWLVDHGADPSERDELLALHAIQERGLEAALEWEASGGNLRAREDRALVIAVARRDEALAAKLLEVGADPASRLGEPILVAASNNDAPMLRLLLARSKPNAAILADALATAASRDLLEATRALLDHGASPLGMGGRPLESARRSGASGALRMMLDALERIRAEV